MVRALIVFAILIPGIAAAVVNRYAALLLYLWFAVFRPQEWLWFDITSYRPSLMLGALLIVPCLATGYLPNLTHPLMIWSALFLVAGLLGQLNAVTPAIGWLWLDFLARLLLVCAFTVTLVDTRGRFKWAVGVVAASFGFYAAKAGLVFLGAGGVQFEYGLSGAYVDNNGYALGTVMIIPLLLATAQNMPNRWPRLLLWASVPLCMLTVIGTFSRAGFLGLVTIVLSFAVLQRRKALTLTGLITVALIALVLVPIPDRYFDRIQTIRTYEEVEDDSAISRLHFWQVAWNMALDYPTGIGLHNYEDMYDRYDFTNGRYGRQRAVHNSTMQVLAEAGFPGLFVWVALFVTAFGRCWRIRKWALRPDTPAADARFFSTYAQALAISMCGFVVAGSFIALSLNDLTWLTFAFVACLDRLWQKARVPATVQPEPSTAPWSVGPVNVRVATAVR